MSYDPYNRIAPNVPDDEELFATQNSRYPSPEPAFDPQANTPSLPIILISAASGVSFAVLGLYVSYLILGLEIAASTAIATLSLCLGLGLTGATLSTLTGSRAAAANIFFSCGLVLATLLFFGLCVLIGAIAATLTVTLW